MKKGGFMKDSLNKNIEDNLREIDGLICKFDHFLNFQKGLAQGTRKVYCSYVRVFLNIEFTSKKIQIKKLRPKNIFRFVLSYAQEGMPARSRLMIYSLRAFFRFLELFDLADSLPSVPRCRYDTPEFLSKDQLQILLDSCDRNTAIGLRDYAILMLLIRLGLRRSEVSKLTLNDLDWDKSEIIIRGKGSVSRFPISQELGEALADYLRRARPFCLCNSLFVRSYKPFIGFVPEHISRIVRLSLQRASLNPRHKGPHLLRHSFATNLLAEGKSLHEISMVLRHTNIRTTMIYTHVDFNKLRLLALPWPIVTKGASHE
jgi:integrase/recombinase XerD